MDLGDGIRQHGFRKWYERELLQSHAHLVLTFLCVVGVFAAFEAMRESRATADKMLDVLAIVLCSGVGVWALRRYLRLLLRAEYLAHQADCPGCGTYGRLTCLGGSATEGGLQVRCGKCSHRWSMQE